VFSLESYKISKRIIAQVPPINTGGRWVDNNLERATAFAQNLEKDSIHILD
jgi:hypothetical protein